jgi:hypothetical protein
MWWNTNTPARCYYNSGSFMTEDAGRRVRAGGNLLEVGAADPTGVHPNQEFTATGSGNGHFFEANVVHAAIDRSPHRRRNRQLAERFASLYRY